MSSERTIRILLADDHSKIHRSIAAVIDYIDGMALVAQASNGEEAVQLCREYQPDIVLMDVVMPEMSGIEATYLIRQEFPDTKILALSSFEDEDSVRDMLLAGAVGYLLKNSSIDDLASTIRAAYAGKAVFSPEITQALLQKPESPQQDYGLTSRELEILKLMVNGLNNTEIANFLTISPSTAKFHVGHVLSKLGVTSRVEAVALAVSQNLV
jgi:two-component system, NarL family, response regulator LiaR